MTFAKYYYHRLAEVARALDYDQIERGVDLVEAAWKDGRHVFTMGNGGSGSTASHYICDWVKGVSYGKEQRIRGICLNDNVPTLLAYANDVSYRAVFVEQLKNFMRPGDLVIGLSGSGNSANVLDAMEWANANGGVSLGVCGFDGGKLKPLAQHAVHIGVNDMQIVEDLHLSFGHLVMQRLSGHQRVVCAVPSGGG
jgi:D-sedoheptulose 7-phosphate isomerase